MSPGHPFAGRSRFELRPVGGVAELRLGKMLQPRPSSPLDTAVPYLRAGSLGTLVETDELPTMFASPRDIQRYGVRPGDLVVAEGGDVGRTAFVPEPWSAPTIIQNSLHRLRPRQGDARFLRYALDAVYASGWLDVLCNRSTFGHLTVEKLSSIRLPWPSPTQQRLIAGYLDVETARIDALVRLRERMLAELSTRWRTVVVTTLFGLDNATAILNDEQPELPRGWQTRTLVDLTDRAVPIVYGILLPGPRLDEGVAYVGAGDIASSRLALPDLPRTTAVIAAAYPRSRVQAGELVYAIRGSVGAVEQVPDELHGVNLSRDAARIRPSRDVDAMPRSLSGLPVRRLGEGGGGPRWRPR